MTYAAPFHRLVLLGTQFTDTWATSLSLIHPDGVTGLAAVTDTLLEEVAAEVATWFAGTLATPTGVGFNTQVRLTSIKLNRIGTDGKYMDADAKEHVYTSSIPGGGAGTYDAPQLATVVSLRGAAPRARAGRGRMYLPPSSSVNALGSDGRITQLNAQKTAQGMEVLFLQLVEGYSNAGFTAVAGITSNAGTGAAQVVDVLAVGRAVDTVRSRRNKIAEDYEELEL